MKVRIALFLPLIFFFWIGCGESQKGKDKEGNEVKLNRQDEIRLKQYIVKGRRIYETNCSNCHQPDGAGLGKLYPPLMASDYLSIDSLNRVACLIKYGMEGPIVVNGKEYNQLMPANTQLNNLDIAEVMTYIYNEFGGQTTIITQHDVRKYLDECD
ncbi:MAG TPA: cytochrome C [Cytophagales bacterium]|jgi:cytochrome c551|nr:cytochrome C [Cytophagales bacterium]